MRTLAITASLVLSAAFLPNAQAQEAASPPPAPAMAATAPTHPIRQVPAGSLTASYAYVYTDSQEGSNRSLMGWSVVPELRVFRNIGFQGDFTSLYVKSVYPGQSRFLIAAGPRYTLAPRARLTPFVFAEGGEMRLTQQNVQGSDWNPVAKGGIGVSYKLSHDFAFQLIPGEYLGQYQDNGEWQHSFTARAGFTLNFVNR